MTEAIERCPSAVLQCEDSGWTPLHIASFMGNVKLVKLFLENGTSSLAYVKNKEGLSAFHIAAKEGNVEVMKELITKYPVVGQQGSNDSSCCCRKRTARSSQFFPGETRPSGSHQRAR